MSRTIPPMTTARNTSTAIGTARIALRAPSSFRRPHTTPVPIRRQAAGATCCATRALAPYGYWRRAAARSIRSSGLSNNHSTGLRVHIQRPQRDLPRLGHRRKAGGPVRGRPGRALPAPREHVHRQECEPDQQAGCHDRPPRATSFAPGAVREQPHAGPTAHEHGGVRQPGGDGRQDRECRREAADHPVQKDVLPDLLLHELEIVDREGLSCTAHAASRIERASKRSRLYGFTSAA